MDKTADPRLAARKELGNLPRLNTQQIPSGHLSSETQTPITPQALMSQDDRIKDLAGVLNDFTSHVIAMASLTLLQDMAKSDSKKKEGAFELGKKYHDNYVGLAETQENMKVTAGKRSEELDQRLQEHTAAREKLSMAIASKVISHSNSKDLESLKKVESDLLGLKKRVNDQTSEFGQVRYLLDKTTEHGNLLSATQDELEKTRASFASMGASLNKLEKRVDDFPDMRMEITKIRDDMVQPISKSLEKAMSNVERLNQTVEGEKERSDAQSKRYDESLEKLDVDQDRADHELGEHDSRLWALETELATIKQQVKSDVHENAAASAVSNSDVTRLEADLESFRIEQQSRDDLVVEEMETTQTLAKKLESDFKNFEVEVDKIQKAVTKLESGVKHTEVEIEQINGWIDDRSQEHRPSISDRRASLNGEVNNGVTPVFPHATPASNGTQISPEVEEVREMKRRLIGQLNRQKEFHQQMEGFKYGLELLDMRFNKLNTEDLARVMVGQMSKIYPQANAILAAYKQSKVHQETMQTKVQELSDRLEKLSTEQQPKPAAAMTAPASTALTVVNGQNHGGETYSKEEIDRELGQLRAYLQQMIDLTTRTAKEMKELKTRVNSIWDSTAKEFGELFVQVEALKEHQEGQQHTDGGRGTSTRPTSEAGSAAGTTTNQSHNAAAGPKAASHTATNTPASNIHSPATREQSVDDDGMNPLPSRAAAVKKRGRRGRKRKRTEISESESDWKQDADDLHEGDDDDDDVDVAGSD
ncbi:MAG: hypothetical protein M1816_002485 [Peltula sp. TS41687]|nr:MAG: hypothetical protein M1816_002485 [Peltula sp. TS41687]